MPRAVIFSGCVGISLTAVTKSNSLRFARESPILVLAFRSKEALPFIGAELYGHIERRPSLVKDTGGAVIARSMQLIAGRSGQEYNQ